MSISETQRMKHSMLPIMGWGLLALILALSLNGADIRFGELWENRNNMASMASGFFPPDFSELETYLRDMLTTIQIAIWGTFLAVIFAIPFGLLSASTIAPVWIVQPARRLMDACRAINEMVFALLFIVAIGLGPFTGVMALFVHTTGVLAKLFSENVEALDPRPVMGIRATGAGVISEIQYGIIPQVTPLWSSYILYRFEANVRSATVLGIVGAGGIGQVLFESIRGFSYQQACAIIIVIVISVTIIDVISAQLRKYFV